jgi:uncharacterized repeat protein (TIGR01451 family)
MNVGAGSGMTIEAWVYSTDNNTARPIVEWVSPIIGGYGVHFYVHQGGPGALYADLYDTANNHHSIQSATGLILTNVFQHVAVTYDKASGLASLFVNGTQVIQSTLGTFTPQTSPDLSIGYRPNTVPFGPIAFVGRIDEVTLYSRALSAAELQTIYAAGVAGKCFSAPPSISTQPTNQATLIGGSAVFNAVAIGSQPLSYQWTFNGTNLPGATKDSLVLTNVQMTDAGTYAVQITNSLGSILSSNAVLTVTVPACANTPAGLVSWWKGDGNALDTVGTNNGGLFNGATFATAGEVGGCFGFNGTSSYVEIPDSPSLNFTNDFTVELWYKDMGVAPGAYAGLVAKRPYSGPCNFGLTMTGGSQGTFLVYFLDPNYGSYQGSTFSPLPTPGAWHHLAASFHQVTSEQIEIDSYTDGQLVKKSTFSGNLGRTVSNYPVHLGCSNPPGGEFFNGDLDEVSLYGRALGDSEIKAIFNAGSLGKCVSPAPPSIFNQPANQNAVVGSTVSFSVGAGGTEPLFYQWMLGGTNLPSATNALLTLTNIQIGQSGTYAVSVSNSLGEVLSSNALLTVTPPPPCTSAPSNLVAWWPAEGNANDLVGTDNGTILNGITFLPGKVGQAFNFDGVTGAIIVPASATLSVQDLTIETWIFPTDLSKPRPIFEYADATGLSTLNFWYCLGNGAQPVSGALFAAARDGANVNNNFYLASSGGLLPANQWSHVAFTFDSTAGKATLYLNGVIVATNTLSVPVHPNTKVAVNIGYRPSGSADLYAGFRHVGKLDEVTLYNRALGQSEIQAIYNAGSSGKCLAAMAPYIASQPANQNGQVGSLVYLSVGAIGSQPLSYQWSLNGTAISGATNASLVLTKVQMNQAGTYAVVITNAYGSATSSNATLLVNFPPAGVTVVSASGTAGQIVTVPVVLVANGNENSLGFSLNFSPTLLTNAGVTLGPAATGALLQFNTNQPGAVGVGIALPSGTTFAPRTQEVAEISFMSQVAAKPYTAALSFGDQPVARQLSDATAHPLAANFIGGQVSLSRSAFEADVAPRPDGDGAVTIVDWVQVGRYVAALDSPTNASEFQRADCAPRSTLGDGLLTVSDWVQAGRYAAGLDPLTVAGGPVAPSGNQVIISKAGKRGTNPSREVDVQGPLIFQGQTGTAAVMLQAQGDENAVGFSLSFDPKVVTYINYTAGSDASNATMDINANQSTNGQLGIILALPTDVSFSPGARQLVKVNFQAVTAASVSEPVTLTDLPVRREVSDTNALPVVATYANGTISVNPKPSLTISETQQSINLSWPLWATNYTLQEAVGSTLPITSWTNLAVTPIVKTNAITVGLPLSGSVQFYRLKHL